MIEQQHVLLLVPPLCPKVPSVKQRMYLASNDIVLFLGREFPGLEL